MKTIVLILQNQLVDPIGSEKNNVKFSPLHIVVVNLLDEMLQKKKNLLGEFTKFRLQIDKLNTYT